MFEDDQQDLFVVARLLEDVLEGQDEVKALYFNRVKDNKFTIDVEDNLH